MLLTREQLQERLLALHRASLELVKDVSLEHLLEQIAKAACEQAGAQYAALSVSNGEGEPITFVTVGLTGEQFQKIEHPPIGAGLIGELMNTEFALRVPVIREHPKSVGFPKDHPEMIPFLGVPIRAGDQQLGQIYLTNKIETGVFDENDEMIIQMLAAYASAAIQNARLVEQLRGRDATLTRRNVDMNLLNDIASTLTSSLELDEILEHTLALVMSYLNVEAGEIFLLEEDKTTLRLVLHRGEAAEIFWNRNIFQIGEGYPGIAAQTRKPLVGTHLTEDKNFIRAELIRAGFQQIACIPLLSGENLIGVMNTATRSAAPIDERNVEMLVAVATWAGLAIENAQLHANARRLAVLEERNRIGMDLHDGIIQSIYGVGLTLESARYGLDDASAAKERMQHAIDQLNHTIRDIRAYILDLKPRQLGTEGLINGIKRLLMEYRANTFAETHFTEPSLDLNELSHAQSVALFHICQEALANIAKHAKAKKVEVALWIAQDRLLMEIKDNGKGFEIDKTQTTLGHGLANMQTRVRSVGGDFDLSSNLGEGTTILVWVPYQINPKPNDSFES
ncbi:MAG: GAF domain-containing sensor histidine kinase [Anaerolineales bacterium]|nr:GAF domain-containing sensor histidine kinase [Anaerolineales bacterium]